MDPIRPKFTPPSVQAPKQVEQTKAAGASKGFDAGETAAAQNSAPANAAARPMYDRISARIQDGVNRSLNREQVLSEVVDGETQQAFGAQATPQMTEAITQAFKNDPHLSQIFNQLYNKATSRS